MRTQDNEEVISELATSPGRRREELAHHLGNHFRMGIMRHVPTIVQFRAGSVRQSAQQYFFAIAPYHRITRAADQQHGLPYLG